MAVANAFYRSNKKSRVLSGETTAAYLFKLDCPAGHTGPKEQWHFSSLGCKRPQIPLLPRFYSPPRAVASGQLGLSRH